MAALASLREHAAHLTRRSGIDLAHYYGVCVRRWRVGRRRFHGRDGFHFHFGRQAGDARALTLAYFCLLAVLPSHGDSPHQQSGLVAVAAIPSPLSFLFPAAHGLWRIRSSHGSGWVVVARNSCWRRIRKSRIAAVDIPRAAGVRRL